MDQEKLAELVGIILGDGSINIYKNHKRLKITSHSEDIEYAAYISSLFIELFNVKPIVKFRKKENTLDIFVFKREIIYYFLNLGMKKSPKPNRAIIPEKFLEKKLSKFILRGLFDTDGSVVITNNNGTTYPRLEIKISESPMQKQVIKLIKEYGFRFGVYNVNDHTVRIQMNGKEQLKKWTKEIGFSNQKHIKKIRNSGSQI